VQGSFTKKLPGLTDLSYNDRLISLDAESLEPKWVCLNLILAYMKQFDLIYINAGNYFSFANSGYNTRGHSYTLLTHYIVSHIIVRNCYLTFYLFLL
jgi:hypothetical protein